MNAAPKPTLSDVPDSSDLDFTPPRKTRKNIEGFHMIAAAPRAAAAALPVLVVDGDIDAGQAHVDGLRAAGLQAALVASMRGAVHRILELGAPAALLVASDLPELREEGFVRRLRRDRRLQQTVIVLIGPGTGREELIRALQQGADGYLAEPMEGPALASAVKSMLGVAA